MIVNREVKVRGGPMQDRFSKDLNAMNIFVKKNHLLAKLRSVLKKNTFNFLIHRKLKKQLQLPPRNMKT